MNRQYQNIRKVEKFSFENKKKIKEGKGEIPDSGANMVAQLKTISKQIAPSKNKIICFKRNEAIGTKY